MYAFIRSLTQQSTANENLATKRQRFGKCEGASIHYGNLSPNTANKHMVAETSQAREKKVQVEDHLALQ